MMDGAITWLYAAMSDYFASGTTPQRGATRLDGAFPFTTSMKHATANI